MVAVGELYASSFTSMQALYDACFDPRQVLLRVAEGSKQLVQQVDFREAAGAERRSYTRSFAVSDEMRRQIAFNTSELDHIQQLPRGSKSTWNHLYSLVNFTCQLRRDMSIEQFREAYVADMDALLAVLLAAFDM